jgi:hypothetical protein
MSVIKAGEVVSVIKTGGVVLVLKKYRTMKT